MTTFCTGAKPLWYRFRSDQPLWASAHKPQGTAPPPINVDGPHADRQVLFSVGYPLVSSPLGRVRKSCDTSRAGSLPPSLFLFGADRPTEPRLCAETSQYSTIFFLARSITPERYKPKQTPQSFCLLGAYIHSLLRAKGYTCSTFTHPRVSLRSRSVFTLVLIRAITSANQREGVFTYTSA